MDDAASSEINRIATLSEIQREEHGMNQQMQKPKQINGAEVEKIDTLVSSGMNVSGTRPDIDAWLTQRCSLPVHDGHRVYFVLCGEFIKVGFSSNPYKRLSSMQTGSPFPLVMLADIPGSKDDEQEIHRMFPDLHVRGEWFRDDPRIRSFIASTRVDRRLRRVTRPYSGRASQYELVNKDGKVYGPFNSLSEAKYIARHTTGSTLEVRECT